MNDFNKIFKVNYKLAYNYGIYNWIKKGKNPKRLMETLNRELGYELQPFRIYMMFNTGYGSIRSVKVFAEVCEVSYDILLGCPKCLKSKCVCLSRSI